MVVRYQHTTARGEYTLHLEFATEEDRDVWIQEVTKISEDIGGLIRHGDHNCREGYSDFRDEAKEVHFPIIRDFMERWGRKRVPQEVVMGTRYLEGENDTPEEEMLFGPPPPITPKKPKAKKAKKAKKEDDHDEDDEVPEEERIARSLAIATQRPLKEVKEALARGEDKGKDVDAIVTLEAVGYSIVGGKIPNAKDIPCDSDDSSCSEHEQEKVSRILLETANGVDESLDEEEEEEDSSSEDDDPSKQLNFRVYNDRKAAKTNNDSGEEK